MEPARVEAEIAPVVACEAQYEPLLGADCICRGA